MRQLLPYFLMRYLENNKDEIIQSSKNDISSLQNHVGKLERQAHLLNYALINNEVDGTTQNYKVSPSQLKVNIWKIGLLNSSFKFTLK